MPPTENIGELVLPAFGVIDRERVLMVDELFAVVKDKYPVTPGHTLIIPCRAAMRFVELSVVEKPRLLELVEWVQGHLAALQPAPEGFNLG